MRIRKRNESRDTEREIEKVGCKRKTFEREMKGSNDEDEKEKYIKMERI